MKKLNTIFLTITLFSLVLLLYSWYNNREFDNNPISQDIKQMVATKKFEMLKTIKYKYKIDFKVPLIITDKMNSKLFGLTTFDTKTQKIKVYLNKKRFKESLNYMLEDVIAHEYAHALMFSFGNFSSKNSGHTLAWQKICKSLNGKRCDRFVNHNDILIDKTKLPF